MQVVLLGTCKSRKDLQGSGFRGASMSSFKQLKAAAIKYSQRIAFEKKGRDYRRQKVVTALVSVRCFLSQSLFFLSLTCRCL